MKKLSLELSSLREWQQIAIGAAIVRRMSLNFTLFCDVTSFDNAHRFNSILGIVWEYANGINENVDFEKQLGKAELLMPDPDDYDMYGVWPAMDAVTALISLLGACQKWDAAEITALLQLSESTIAAYLQVTGQEEGFAGSQLARDDTDYLKGAMAIVDADVERLGRRQVVKELRQMAMSVESSNIGLSL